MVILLCPLCIVLCIIILLLLVKIALLHRAADELMRGFSEKLKADSNTGISLSTTDRKMCLLAAEMNRQLAILRSEHLRYTRGDQELKNAIMNISHDLRTPLTAICGYLDLLEDEDVSDTVRDYLSVIRNRIDALTELSEEFFRYSVVIGANADEPAETLRLNSVLEECLAGFYGAFMEAGIKPETAFPEVPVVRRKNRQAMMRIFSNIINNALKYSDGDFLVTLDESGSICFSNHAAALDEVLTGHLFDRFFTVENARNSTGLGLAIARTLTEKQGGSISAFYREGCLHIRLVFPE